MIDYGWEGRIDNMKKIIIISDIHANLAALQTIRHYMDQEQIDCALNLGDFISNGPNPCEVFDCIMADQRFINIQGYDEESLFDKNKRKEGIGQGEWLINQLGKKRVDLLSKTPSIKTVQINNKKFLMTHHNGWSKMLQEKAHKDKKSQEHYDYIAYGGSHLQELCHTKDIFFNTTIFDPGTLVPNKDSKGYFALIHFNDTEPMIQFCNILIDKQDTVALQQETIIEKEKLMKDAFLYIKGKTKDNDGTMYIDNEVVEEVIKVGIRQCKYVCIGCWKHEKQLIREILYYLKCRGIKSSEEDTQEWYIGEITKEVEELLLEKRYLADGKLKWFEISFLDDINNNLVMYSIYQYGQQCFLRKLSLHDLYNMQAILKKHDVSYKIPEQLE